MLLNKVTGTHIPVLTLQPSIEISYFDPKYMKYYNIYI